MSPRENRCDTCAVVASNYPDRELRLRRPQETHYQLPLRLAARHDAERPAYVKLV